MEVEEILKSIRERCEAATEGPWSTINIEGYREVNYETDGVICKMCTTNDRRFIAHARTDVPMLLEMIGISIDEFGYHGWYINRLKEILEKYNARED